MSDQPIPVTPPRAPWRQPVVRRLNAAAARNGFGGADDGGFTGS